MPRPRYLEKIKAIPLDELPCDNVSNTASGSEDNITLDRCIEMFSEAEILEENEYWYCSTCKVSQLSAISKSTNYTLKISSKYETQRYVLF